MYVEADLKTKEQALQNVAPAGKGFRRFQPGDALLAFLDALWRIFAFDQGSVLAVID